MTEPIAPEDEIEMTPEMIAAGLRYLEDTGVASLTSRVTYADFVVEFYKAIIVASKR